MNYKLYSLGGNVLNNYRKYVKGNDSISKRLARRKLTRNILLSLKLSDNTDGRSTNLYAYGNLLIFVRGDKITRIKNRKVDSRWFFKDKNKYNELNEKFEINYYEKLESL